MKSASHNGFGTVRGSRLARAPRHAGGGGIAATALAFLAALLLAPGEARADNECGTISSTAQTATCTATHGGGSGTFGSGILYVNAAPGANNVATVVVPGGSAPWAVTAAAGSGNERKNAITLDSDGAAAGGLALTVGGASSTANQVAIARHATNTDTGDAGNGIYMNQQRTGASTTTLTVNAGVTIGTSSAPMRSHGIRANVWLGTGAASFTSAATIHSVSAGIYVNRGDSADTAAATTITNTGAITSGTRVIQLRYFAGDTTGSNGNTASTTTGAATITNSGVLTKNAGTGNQGAIELDYDRGHGDATITNRGAITYGSAATGGYGIYLNYNNRAGTATGDATITNTAAIASAGHAIYLNYGGRGGATTITNSGALTATAASSFGIYLFEHGTLVDPATKVVTVDNSGDITSTGLGINVNVRNKNIAGSNVGIAITHSAGDIVVSAAGGIKANIADNDDVAANNAGDIRISVTGGSVQSRDTILEASHSQAGDVIFEVSDGVTLTSTAQHGIFANIPSANTVGDITVTNAGTITTPKTGIFIRSSAPTGTGDISVTNSGDIKKTGDTDWDGILVEDLGTGDITVRNSGNIGDADDMHERGIRVQKQAGAASGDVTITTTGGSIFADNVGIWVTDTGDHTGDVTISNGGDITAKRPISVVRNGGGAVSVTNTGGTVRSETLNAIAVRNKTGDASTVTVNVGGGTVRSPGNAIQAFNRGTGDVSMDFTGGELISEAGTAVYAQLPTTFQAGNQVKVAQGAKILGRTGFYANARGYSVADPVEARADGKPNVVDVTWTGSFSHGTTDAEKAMVAQSDDGTYAVSFVGRLISAQETLGGEDATDGVYGGAAGVEAQVMSRSEIIQQVALGDDPGMIADDTAQMAAVPAGATAADNAYVAQFGAALEDPRFDIDSSVLTAIASGTTAVTDLTDPQIVTYLQTSDADTKTLLRNILSLSLSDGEKAVLKALATGDSAGLATALDARDENNMALFSDAYKTAVRALLNRYNTGNIKVAMNGGSIDSRGDGIRAYYATANDNNGAINVSVAEGATVTGGKTGIYVANAGLNAGEDADSTADDILKQIVTVHGMVTGGTDAAVHLVGGGTLTVGEMGKVYAGAGDDSSGRAIWVDGLGRAVIRIDGKVRGGEGAPAAVHLTGGGSSVTLGPVGSVDANGATNAIRGDGAATKVVVEVAASGTTDTGYRYVDDDGTPYRQGVENVNDRLKGGVAGDGITGTGSDGGGVRLAVADAEGMTGMEMPVPLNEEGLLNVSGFTEAPHPPCPAGEVRGADGMCAPPPPEPCPAGEVRGDDGMCAAPPPEPCPAGEVRGDDGMCAAPPPEPCPAGEVRGDDGMCAAPPPEPCPAGEVRGDDGMCRAMAPPPMPSVLVFDCSSEPGSCVGINIEESRSAGIRALYAEPSDSNGRIAVTVAAGTTVESAGAEAGIYVANAGLGDVEMDSERGRSLYLREDVTDLRQHFVTVHGTVMGGTEDAAVHLNGGGVLLVGETGSLNASPGQPAVLVNDPGEAVIVIEGEVKGGADADAAVHLTGGGSVTVGLEGLVDANGADRAIRGDGAATKVTYLVAADGMTGGRRHVSDGGAVYREGAEDAVARVRGGIGGDGITDSEGGGVTFAVVDSEGQTGMETQPVPINPTSGDPNLDPDPGDDAPRFDPAPAPAPMMVMNCDEATDKRCRLYEALPSALLAMNGLPSYEERMSAARDARGGWARVEAARGKWKADTSTRPDVAYDHRRHGVRAGVDFAMGDDAGRIGVSVHGLRGSAEMTGGGEIDLSGAGVGVHATRALDGGFHVDAQAAVTWYDADLESMLGSTLKNGVNGRGYALGVEVGKRLPAGGVAVTPRAGLVWSKADLDDFRDARFATVSVKDAQSLKGRAGVGVEKVLDGDGMDGSRLFGSLDVEQEFKEETESMVEVSGTSLKASARKTRFRAAAGAVHAWGEGRYALQGSLGYAAGGGGNRDFGGGLSFAMRF